MRAAAPDSNDKDAPPRRRDLRHVPGGARRPRRNRGRPSEQGQDRLGQVLARKVDAAQDPADGMFGVAARVRDLVGTVGHLDGQRGRRAGFHGGGDIALPGRESPRMVADVDPVDPDPGVIIYAFKPQADPPAVPGRGDGRPSARPRWLTVRPWRRGGLAASCAAAGTG